MKTALVIGGGFTGCASAHQLALAGGWDVTLVEAAASLGAGVRTRWFGGHPYTFGPRHFLTQNELLFEFLNRYVPMRRCPDHQFWTYVEGDNQFYNYPIHVDDIPRMPDHERVRQELREASGADKATNLEEFWVRSVGRTLYEKMIKGYNEKMWLMDDVSVIDTFHWSPKGVAIKEGPRAAWDTAISAYPYAANGYDDYFAIATEGTRVMLSTRIEHYNIPARTVTIAGEQKTFDIIINTISPDILFEYAHGALPYVGLDLSLLVLPMEQCFPPDVYFLYYANNEPFKRLVEYKRFTHHKSLTTLIGIEIPSMNGKHYPLPIKAEQAKAKRYFAEMPDGVFSIGRAGSYEYLDIGNVLGQAVALGERLKG